MLEVAISAFKAISSCGYISSIARGRLLHLIDAHPNWHGSNASSLLHCLYRALDKGDSFHSVDGHLDMLY